MEKEFILYDRALRMKELGFDEPCFGIYDMDTRQFIQNILCTIPDTCTNEAMGCISNVNWITAPTFSQAFRWFREKYDMAHQITYAGAKGRYNAFIDDWVYDSSGELKEFSYEEAELTCLDKLIEIVESKQKEDGK